ncbi:MAG: mycothiol synthase [Candidatus Nanopelagicales bacterium]
MGRVPATAETDVERIDGVPSAALQRAIRAVSAAATEQDGAVPLSDAAVLSPGANSVHLCVWSAGEGHRPKDRQLDGYAFVDPETGIAEIVVRPAARGRGMGGALMAAALAAGGRGFWAHGDLPAAKALAEGHGARAERTLFLLERVEDPSGSPASAAGPTPSELGLPEGFVLRPYAGPADDAGLLRVNAAAFTDLPDQGQWSRSDLRARVEADWFDAGGLLVLERSNADVGGAGGTDRGAIVGFHWTKVHPDNTGEVYVLALDPAVQGHGLAEPLTRAGLAQLARRGCTDVILFVDAGNARALRLYEGLGFARQRRDVLYAASARSSRVLD